MRNSKHNQKDQNFDQIIFSRLVADDFGQPQIKDKEWFHNRATAQIKSAIQAIFKANNQLEYTAAIAQANAFIDSALNLEIIDLTEKAKWLDDVAIAKRKQLIEEAV